MELVNQFLFYGLFAGFATFVVLYSLRSPWWATPIGKNMLAFMTVNLVLMGLGVLRRLFGPAWFEAHRDGLQFFSFGALFVVVWWRVFILVKVQKQEVMPEPPFQRKDDTDPNLRAVS